MTYRSDPYDPKQVALLDQAALDDAVAGAEKAFAAAADLDALTALRPAHLGGRLPVSPRGRGNRRPPPGPEAHPRQRGHQGPAGGPGAHDRPAPHGRAQ